MLNVDSGEETLRQMFRLNEQPRLQASNIEGVQRGIVV